MIATLLKVLLITSLGILAYQDFKERMVWFFLPMVVLVIGSYLFYLNSEFRFYLFCVQVNLIIIATILLVLFLVSKFILKKSFLKQTFGMADIIILVALAVSFPTISFLIFYVGSLVIGISIYLYLRWKHQTKNLTIPLAGGSSLFLIGIYIAHWVGMYTSIYYL